MCCFIFWGASGAANPFFNTFVLICDRLIKIIDKKNHDSLVRRHCHRYRPIDCKNEKGLSFYWTVATIMHCLIFGSIVHDNFFLYAYFAAFVDNQQRKSSKMRQFAIESIEHCSIKSLAIIVLLHFTVNIHAN